MIIAKNPIEGTNTRSFLSKSLLPVKKNSISNSNFEPTTLIRVYES